jgi:hypothetical protein
MSVLTLVANEYTQLTNTEKANLLANADDALPTAAEIESLGEFKIVTTYPYSSLTLKAIPNDKLVLPKELFGSNFENIDSITITQTELINGKIRYIVTGDLNKYYTWDSTNHEFIKITPVSASNVVLNGMTAAQMATIPSTEWVKVKDPINGLGIGFALSIDSTTDKAEIDNMSMQVDMKGKWKRAVHSTDYDYAYTSNNLLIVTLNTNGTYKINYA